VNRPGLSSTSQPRSTSRFNLPRTPSTRNTTELSQPSATAVCRAVRPSPPASSKAAADRGSQFRSRKFVRANLQQTRGVLGVREDHLAVPNLWWRAGPPRQAVHRPGTTPLGHRRTVRSLCQRVVRDGCRPSSRRDQAGAAGPVRGRSASPGDQGDRSRPPCCEPCARCATCHWAKLG
jgi:hypothetical protein